MKVLVTGATGFIGRKVVGRLQGAGFDVCIASRRPGRLSAAVLLPGIEAPDGAFLALMRDVTHVVHCAALNNDRNASDADYQTANATLTGRLAKAAAASTGGRFIYLSSIRAVAGPGFSGTINEATPPAPPCIKIVSSRWSFRVSSIALKAVRPVRASAAALSWDRLLGFLATIAALMATFSA